MRKVFTRCLKEDKESKRGEIVGRGAGRERSDRKTERKAVKNKLVTS